jgi:hypothetical protein
MIPDNIQINAPPEFIEALNTVIRSGLQNASITRNARENLTGWWDAEWELLQIEINGDERN